MALARAGQPDADQPLCVLDHGSDDDGGAQPKGSHDSPPAVDAGVKHCWCFGAIELAINAVPDPCPEGRSATVKGGHRGNF